MPVLRRHAPPYGLESCLDVEYEQRHVVQRSEALPIGRTPTR